MSLSRSLQYLFLAIVTISVGFSLYQWNASRASTQKTAPKNGLVGYWSFDENTGTKAGDASGNGNTGTLTNGPTWVSGKLGQAVNFDGVDDYVITNLTTHYSQTTFSAWIYPRTLGEGNLGRIFDKRENGGTETFFLSMSTGTNKLLLQRDFSVTNGLWNSPNSSIVLNAWNHIVITYDETSTANDPVIYINGISVTVSEVAAPSGTAVTNADKYIIGNRGDTTRTFDGIIDEVRIYNRALSGTEVTNLYNLGAEKLNVSPTTSLTSGLVGYWTFDGKDTPWTSSSAGTATDRSGNGNTGTLTNMSQSTSPIIGKLGQALKFDGVNQYITTTNTTSFDNLFSSAITLCAWAKFPNFTNYNRLITIENNAGTDYDAWIQVQQTSGIVQFGAGGTGKFKTGTTALSANIWYHLCGVTDYTAGGTKIFINGVEDTGSLASTPTYTADKGYLDIGRLRSGGGSNYGTGTIDEVRVYNRALSATEVQSLYDLGASDKVNSSVSQNQGVGRLDSGLVGYWKLDDGSGTTATDSSTNANNGTLTGGPTWGTGKIGGAVDFTGQKYITIPNSTPLQVTGNMTVSFWIYHRSTFNSDWDPIVSKFNSDANNEFNIRARNSNEGQFYTGTGGGFITWDPDADIGLNRWTHVVARRNLNAGVMDMWFNGIKKRSGGSGAAVSSTTQPLQLGSGPNGGTVNRAFDGLLDEVRIYNRAITDDEIAQLYRLNQPSGTDTSLKGYWSFNGSDISGTTAYDRSGNANNGTLTNGPTPTIGKSGQALSFNGSNNYVSMGSAPTSGFPLTTSAWFKTTDATASYRSISSIYGSSNSAIAILQFDSGGGGCANSKRVKYVVRDTSGGASTSICSSSDLNDGVWHHIVGVSSSASNHTLYIDGVSQGNSTTSLGATAFNSMQVGCYTSGQYFPGSIDEVRVYNRALSSTEISALYNAGR